MATKKIRLTESELTNLIRRIVEDSENTMGMESEMSKNEVVELISDFFKDEVLPELTPRETRSLKQKLERPQSRGIREDEEGHSSLSDRTSNFREKLMMKGGLGMAGVGAIAALGEFTGWSEHELTSKIHEFVEMAGAGNYSGPITVAMVAAGLAIALRGRAKQYSRTGE
jgi:hypothetical protein